MKRQLFAVLILTALIVPSFGAISPTASPTIRSTIAAPSTSKSQPIPAGYYSVTLRIPTEWIVTSIAEIPHSLVLDSFQLRITGTAYDSGAILAANLVPETVDGTVHGAPKYSRVIKILRPGTYDYFMSGTEKYYSDRSPFEDRTGPIEKTGYFTITDRSISVDLLWSQPPTGDAPFDPSRTLVPLAPTVTTPRPTVTSTSASSTTTVTTGTGTTTTIFKIRRFSR